MFFSDLFLCVFLIAALLQEQWEALALKLSQTQEQIRACESALVFAFVEVIVTPLTSCLDFFFLLLSPECCGCLCIRTGDFSPGCEERRMDPAG